MIAHADPVKDFERISAECTLAFEGFTAALAHLAPAIQGAMQAIGDAFQPPRYYHARRRWWRQMYEILSEVG